MNGDADVLGAASLASKLWRQIPVHCAMIRPELGFQGFQIEIGAFAITGGRIAMYGDALPTVYAFLDGAHRFFPDDMTSS